MPPVPTSSIEPSVTAEPTPAWMLAWQRAYAAHPLQLWASGFSRIAPSNATGRSGADALAAWQRWHGPQIDALVAQLFSPAELPWYAVLERARVETLASQDLPGIACNLARLQDVQPADAHWAWLYLGARQVLGGGAMAIHLPPAVEPTPLRVSSWSRWFKRAAINGPAPTANQIAEALQQAKAVLADGKHFAHTVLPLVHALAAHHGRKPAGDARLPATPRHGGDGLQTQDQEHTQAAAEVQTPGGSSSSNPPGLLFERAYPGYTVFSHQWDEEAPAARWHDAQDGVALRHLNALDRHQVRRLAYRLQRRLQAARFRHWSFDQEEGRLDSRRLARLLANTDRTRVFRVEAEAPTPEACVTLLVDQSGSMRGERQLMTALAIDLAVHALQACQVRCEVLGYTTGFGADNPLVNQWKQAKHPLRPGRLNALRHIVYKAAAQPWQQARTHLGLLLREGFGQENIDGEALHWAATRLVRQPESRKILIVLSDGSPYDEATAQANGRTFLESHLREVIAQIEASPITLVAIGAGQDVGRYYRQALTLRRNQTVADVLFERLAELLAPVVRAQTH